VGFDNLKDLFAEIMLLQQVPERQNRGLVRDPVADQLNAGNVSHGGDLNQDLFHRWVAERIPLLQKVDSMHCCQWVLLPAAFLAGLWIVGFDQCGQFLPWHYRDLREKLLPFCLLLDRGDLMIANFYLLAANHPSTWM
jgi:hypothetical protein